MNKKQLLLVIVLGLVIGGAGLYVYKREQASYKEAKPQMGAPLLGEFEINAVNAVHIRKSTNAVDMAQTGDIWTVKQRDGYPADFGKLAQFIRKLDELKIVKPVTAGPSRLPALELVPPDKGGSGTLVAMEDKSGKPVKTLLLGVQHMRESVGGGPFGDNSWPDGRYVMVDGQMENIALVSDPLSQAEPRPEDWISKEFFKVEKPKSITVVSTNATNNWKLVRETEGGEWKLADAQGDEKADSSKTSSMNYVLSSPSFNDVALDFAFNETNKPATVATIQTFDGFTYTVDLAPKSGGDNYFLHVAVSADLPKERTAGPDEKAEDKEKLDREFKEKMDKLEEKLKKESAYEKWTYIVSKWTVDPLLKGRAELVTEKKDEPAPEGPAETIAPKPAEAAAPRPVETVTTPPLKVEPPRPPATNAPATNTKRAGKKASPPPLPPKKPQPKPSAPTNAAPDKAEAKPESEPAAEPDSQPAPK